MRSLRLYLFPLMLLLALGSAAESVPAQTNSVKVSLEKDGKQLNRGFRIQIYPDRESYSKDRWLSKGIKPKVKEHTFTVPPEIRKQEKVAYVILTFSDYSLTFVDLPLSAFESPEWVVGVDTKPFAKENIMQSIPKQEIEHAYYLQFINKEGKEVRILVN